MFKVCLRKMIPANLFREFLISESGTYQMDNPGFSTLVKLVDQLKALDKTKDPSAADELLDWLEKGGLESTKASLKEYLQTVTNGTAPLNTYTIIVRPYYTFATTTFEVPAYTTIGGLKEAIGKAYGTDGKNIDMNDELGTELSQYNDTTVLGEIADKLDFDTTLSVHPNFTDWPPWGVADKGILTVPVELAWKETNSPEEILVPITKTTTHEEFMIALGRMVNVSPVSLTIVEHGLIIGTMWEMWRGRNPLFIKKWL